MANRVATLVHFAALSHPHMQPSAPTEIVVFDQLHPCSYLPGRVARLPYRHPIQGVTPEDFDQRLSEGDRRSGVFLYRTQCPGCRACEPIRLDVNRFQANATQRREKRRGDELLELQIGQPAVDRQRIDLFNLHRDMRRLSQRDEPIDEESYADFLTNTCCETWELSYWHGGRLVAVAIADAGKTSLSAVYCYYDPRFEGVSVGTYSVLRHIELCRETGRQFLYLGFFVAQSPHMSYKARFHPHERRIGGEWKEFG
jgi:arginyl-tRNA--protein-N-Asp/Glu arginylyltransferase